MPRVPRLESQVAVREANVGFFNPSASAEAFGGGGAASAITQSQGQLLNVATKVAEKFQYDADRTAVVEARNKLKKYSNELLWGSTDAEGNRNAGAFDYKGKDALGIPDNINPSFEKFVADTSNSLANDRQKRIFQEFALEEGTAVQNRVNQYVSQEMIKYSDEQDEQGLLLEAEEASNYWNEPGRLAKAIENQEALIESQALRNGHGEDWKENKLKQVKSATLKQVIGRMLADDQDMLAEKFFKQNKGAFTAKDYEDLERSIEVGSLRGYGQRKSDEIWEKSKGNYSEALAKAREISDPKKREETLRNLRQRQSDQAAGVSAQQAVNYQTASEFIKQKPGVDPESAIPAPLWAELTLEQRDALVKRGRSVPNDNKKWLDFLALTPEQLKGLSRQEFETKYWAHFDDAHRTRAENAWASERQTGGKRSRAHKNKSPLSFQNQFDRTIRNTNILSSPKKSRNSFGDKDRDKYTRLEQMAFEAYSDFQEINKREPDYNESQKIVDDILLNKVRLEGSGWLWDDEVPVGLLRQDQRGNTYVKKSDIPPVSYSRISNAMRSNGLLPTQDKVQKAYALLIQNDMEQFNEYVGNNSNEQRR